MRNKFADIISGTILLIISLIIFIFANKIPRLVVTSIGPGFMPKFVAIIMGGLSILLIIKGILEKSVIVENEKIPTHQNENILVKYIDFITVALLFAYAIGIAKLGFILATILYLVIHISIMGFKERQNIIITILIAIVFAVGIYFLFTKVLYVMLPAGILG
jgi:hypothetical protein